MSGQMERGTVDGGVLPPHTQIREAEAKVNLFLRVLGRRTDGFHELETLIVRVSLADRIQIHGVSDPARFQTLSLSLEVGGEGSIASGVPGDQSNLVLRAAAALAERAGIRGFADILLEKRIPAAAGLGGGSADAASTLTALNELWGVGMENAELGEIGAAVGSDVPALLVSSAALARGRGELVEAIRVPPFLWCLVTFPFGVRTADAFGWWDEDVEHGVAGTGPDPAALLRAAASGDAEAVGPLLFNDLEDSVMRRHPEVRTAKERLIDSGAAGAVMCGSGPTMAGLLLPEGTCSIAGAMMVRSGGE
jgi:4-diphosphocytidyl-2-C-methyl-D-erythritol kinase